MTLAFGFNTPIGCSTDSTIKAVSHLPSWLEKGLQYMTAGVMRWECQELQTRQQISSGKQEGEESSS